MQKVLATKVRVSTSEITETIYWFWFRTITSVWERYLQVCYRFAHILPESFYNFLKVFGIIHQLYGRVLHLFITVDETRMGFDGPIGADEVKIALSANKVFGTVFLNESVELYIDLFQT